MGNTAYLRRRGFNGLLMDGSERPYDNYINDKKYDVKIEFITSSNINELFKKYDVPNDFDFLSIDIDGQDFHVWNKLINYSPRVVSIEMNYHIAAGIDKVMYLDDNWIWDGGPMSGSSVTALKKLGNKKGYSLVATCMSDAIFVRNDLVFDEKNCPLFKNINNEIELVKLNTDIYNENLKYYFTSIPNYFDVPIFSSSEKYL